MKPIISTGKFPTSSKKKKISLTSGLSGCTVSVFQNRLGQRIVRKKVTDKKLNPRLESQYNKHLFFLSKPSANFKVPEIINNGYDDGLFFYDYSYIEGIPFIHFVNNNPQKLSLRILDQLLEVISNFKDDNNFFEVEYKDRNLLDVFKKKIDSNSKHISDSKIKQHLYSKLASLDNHHLKTNCHGDLSFDNVIIDKENNIWLIDYIGVFYPHYWLDYAKLFQDIEGKWSEIKHGIILNREVAEMLTKFAKKRIKKIDPEYLNFHSFFMAFIFLRILPYLKNDSQKKQVEQTIQNYLAG